MKKTILAVAVGLAALAAGAYDDGSWEFWNTESVEYRFAKRWKAKASFEFYFGDEMNDFYYRHAEPALACRVAPWLELGALYRYVEQKKNDDWNYEHRPAGEITFSRKLLSIAFSDRNRLEYRIREDADNFFRYRHRLRAVAPFQWTPLKLQPYLYDEAFWDFDADELNQNRVVAGLSAAPVPHVSADVYYMFKSDRKSGEWMETNVLGLDVKIGF